MVTALWLAAVYLLLLGVVLVRRSRRNPAERWLIAYCAYSAALMGLHALLLSGQVPLPAPLSPQVIVGVAFTISTGLTSALILANIGADRQLLAAVVMFTVVWALGAIAARILSVPALTYPGALLGPVLLGDVTLAAEIVAVGWLLLAGLLLVLTWRAYLSEPLPLYANRILFWVILAPLLLFGDAAAALYQEPWNYVGYAVRVAGALGAVYSVVVLHLLDLREFARRLLSAAVQTLLIAIVLFGAIALPALISFPDLSSGERWMLRAVTAVVVAGLMVPTIQLARWLLRGLLRSDERDPADVVRRYSERISGTVELQELASAASEALCNLLGARSAHLLLATQEPDGTTLEQIGASNGACKVAADSPIYHQFVGQKRALLQYVIDYDRRYLRTPEAERQYFDRLGLDVYAPIVAEGRLAGLLAVGPKASDNAFRPAEIELLEALATQTVAALANARLVADLRTLNERVTALNEDLKATNARLERLDEVKTDFLTVASHELRTPLTQIRGNVEMLLDMAERGLLAAELDEAQAMIRALSRASQRMTEVVVAMLDMTQLDIDSMDLVFADASPEQVVEQAAARYAAAVHERGQALAVNGVADLPPISADSSRLAQAFENIIGNAIKYTPDGGRIEINGQVYEKDDQGRAQSVQLSFTDTGIGVDEEHHKLVFEKFYRVEAAAFHSTGNTKFKGGGPGLGLPMARAIVEGHGGRIWLESAGHDEETCPGTTVNVILPVTPPAIEARERIRKVQLAQDDTDTRTPSPLKGDAAP